MVSILEAVITSLAHSFRDLIDDFCGDFLDPANRLIRLASIAKSVVAGQRACRFLDATLRYVYFATHETTPFLAEVL